MIKFTSLTDMIRKNCRHTPLKALNEGHSPIQREEVGRTPVRAGNADYNESIVQSVILVGQHRKAGRKGFLRMGDTRSGGENLKLCKRIVTWGEANDGEYEDGWRKCSTWSKEHIDGIQCFMILRVLGGMSTTSTHPAPRRSVRKGEASRSEISRFDHGGGVQMQTVEKLRKLVLD
ncbi:hypothetical protein B0H19DRAFT_1066822 [Mycena capillaripes]|nr:hypothetical protein B0H19DRAFT_1066822 [Mycena capillaripes]